MSPRLLRTLLLALSLSVLASVSALAVDADADGVDDAIDNCVGLSNPTQVDVDADGVGNACDKCIVVSNSTQVDGDGDGFGNACDNCRTKDNGPVEPVAPSDPAWAARLLQYDTNQEGYGNACDADYDNTGVVSIGDFNTFKLAYMTAVGDPAFNPHCDANADNLVDDTDFAVFQSLYGKAPGPSDLSCAGSAPCLPLNEPPVLAGIGNRSLVLGDELAIDVTASDRQRQPVTLSVTPMPLPAGASFDLAGQFRFTPTAALPYNFTFKASDGSLTATEAVAVTVSAPGANDLTQLTGTVQDAAVAAGGAGSLGIDGASITCLSCAQAASTSSGANGSFTLTLHEDDAGGTHQIEFAKPPGYAGYRMTRTLPAHVNSHINRPVYLTPVTVAQGCSTAVPPLPPGCYDPDDSNTVTATVPGGEIRLTVPANSIVGNTAGDDAPVAITVAEVNRDFTPGALPETLRPSLVITIQPMGLRFNTPLPIRLPNRDNYPIESGGGDLDLWSLDHDTGRFFVAGQGLVTSSGLEVDPANVPGTRGGIIESSWHFLAPLSVNGAKSQQGDGDNCGDGSCKDEVASDLSLGDGNVTERIELPSYVSQGRSRDLALVYNSKTAYPAPILPVEPKIPQRIALPDVVSYSLRVGNSEVTPAAYTRTGDLSEFANITLRGAVQFDAREIATGAYDARVRQRSHYTDFAAGTEMAIDTPLRLVVQNEIASPFGAGWGLGGLSRLIPNQPDGAILLVDGSGSFRVFDRADRLRNFATDGQFTSSGNDDANNFWAISGTTVSRFVFPAASRTGWFHSDFDFFNSRLRGTFKVNHAMPSNGNPFGFSIGYRRPIAASSADDFGIESITFAWRGNRTITPAIDAGMRLVRINGENNIPGSSLSGNCLFWFRDGESDPDNDLDEGRCAILASDPTPWQGETTYSFEVSYESHRLRVVIEGPGNFSKTFEVFGTFQPGRFAFMAHQDVDFQIFDNIAPAWAGPAGDTSTLVQDGLGGAYRRIFPDGTIHHFDASGKQTKVADANGNETLFGYDPQGRLSTTTDPRDLVTTLTYSGPGNRLSSIQDPAGRITTFQHDPDGNLSDVNYPDNSTRHFSYDARHLLLSETDQLGRLTEHEYDFAGRLVKATLPDPSGTESERFASAAQTVGLLDRSDPAVTSIRPDNPLAVEPPADGSGPSSSYTDAEGRVTSYGIGSFLLASSVKGPDGVTSTLTRDANGDTTLLTRRIEGATPANPTTQEFTASYDAQRNLMGITDNKLSGTTAFSYDPPFVDGAPTPTFNALRTLIDPRNQAASGDRDLNLSYNGPNLTSIATPGGRTQTLSYDPVSDGLPATRTDVFGRVTQLNYDPATRNLTSLTQGTDLSASLQRTTSFSYTPEGYVNTITDAVGRVLDFDYDPMGRVDLLTLPDLRVIDFGYDAKGNLTSINPPGTLAGSHQFALDERDREELYTPPAVGGPVATSFEYNRESQLMSVLRPDGQSLVPGYQAGTGRLLSLTQPSGSSTLAYSTAPAGSATGLLSSVTESFTNGAMSFGYVGDRLSSTTWSGPVSGSVSATFLADGLVGTQSVNGSNLVSFGYDKDGLLTTAGSMTLARNASTGFLESASLGSLSTARTRNDFGELASESTGTLYNLQYPTRDKLGRVTTKIESLQGGASQTTEYTYDAAGRLFQAFENGFRAREYGYDANSNRTSLTHFGPDGVTVTSTEAGIVDAQDRLTSYSGATYSYTANGELLTKTEASQTTTYGYDLLGNLRSVNLPDGRTLSYVIDGANRRIGKRINGTPVQGFLYGDQLEPVAELDGSNALVSRFVYGSKPNVPDYMVRGGQTFRILTDELGTVRLVVSTTGTVRQRIDYDEFGNITSRQEFDASGTLITPTPAPFQPFGFAGGLLDTDIGLTRFGARDYDPAIGRWTSKDPIRFGGGEANLFGYVLSDPINRFDRTGLADVFVGAEVDLVGITGATFSGGIVVDTDDPLSSGIFFSYGAGFGASAGFGFQAGYVCREIEGEGGEVDANLGLVSPTALFDDQGYNGFALSYGPGKGVSTSSTTTTTRTARSVVSSVRAALGL